MPHLDIDPARTRQLAHELRAAAHATSLSSFTPPPLPLGPGGISELARATAAAAAALHRRSAIISAHLDALGVDGETFVSAVEHSDERLARGWEAQA
ncbi:hypothetical protein C3B44_02455 [Corynebacterium yudongzhengii]|uniref:Uncharacterized protein n=1 Tax=Corynebacterium yudongzhengii TaxID=2080740 RepID=A0A2U1T743_9CORY|nr:hypothetical protein [Corynebacterium yudongzhengii]AWB81352.1 hypothetical protein C3B44_02455 [Corynebacterium yudongzhengii]PWC01795.1 hypothetical protein DF222_05540 [Corynebacterium yudongzhengii]